MESCCRRRWRVNAASGTVASGVWAGVVLLLVVACATPPPIRRFVAEPSVGPATGPRVAVPPARPPDYGPCVRVRFKALRSLWGLFRPKYSAQGLETVLTKYFGETRLNEALTLVEIPAYDIEARRHFFFRSDVHTFRMRDVARAATAAPAYFAPVTLPIEPRFSAKGYVALIDGGVFANNPAPYALASAALVRPGSQDVLMVSLGSGALPRPMPYEQAWNWGLLGWAAPLISMIFSDHGVEDAFQHVFPPGRYVRFQTGPAGYRRDLDDASPENVQALKQAAAQLIHERTEDLTAVAGLLRLPRRPDCPPRVGREA